MSKYLLFLIPLVIFSESLFAEPAWDAYNGPLGKAVGWAIVAGIIYGVIAIVSKVISFFTGDKK